MVLWGSSRSGADTLVGGAVDGVSYYVVEEDGVIADDSGRQVVVHSFEGGEDLSELRVAVLCDNLEGPEELGGDELEVFADLLDRDKDRCRLVSPVAVWDVVPLELLSSEEQPGSRDLEDRINVFLDLDIVPGEHRSDCEVGQLSPGSQCLQFFDEPLSHPVLVRKKYRLRGAFLPRGSVGVLVADVGDVVDIGDVRAEDLPVESCVLDLDFPVRHLREVLRDSGGPCELGQPVVGVLDYVLHHGRRAVYHVNLMEWRTKYRTGKRGREYFI